MLISMTKSSGQMYHSSVTERIKKLKVKKKSWLSLINEMFGEKCALMVWEGCRTPHVIKLHEKTYICWKGQSSENEGKLYSHVLK